MSIDAGVEPVAFAGDRAADPINRPGTTVREQRLHRGAPKSLDYFFTGPRGRTTLPQTSLMTCAQAA